MHTTSSTQLLQDGQERQRAGNLDEAEALYRRAAELGSASADAPTPDTAGARLNLGLVLHDLGRNVEAAEVLGQLVVDHPDLAAGWVHLARVIATEGYDWEAHRAVTKALKLNPDSPTLVTASSVLLALKHIPEAEAACCRALELAPTSPTAWIQLGQIRASDGRKLDAAAAYQSAIANDPQNTVAKFFLAALAFGANPNPAAPPTVAPPEYVRDLFDGYAERFDTQLVGSLKYQTPQMLERMFTRHLARNSADVAKPLSIFDAGCGTGLCGPWLCAYRGRLIGADLSRAMLAKAHARQVYDDLIPGEVVAELQKRPAEFDLILAADVLVYIGDLSPLFSAASAALRPGGIFLFSVEAADNGRDFSLLPTQRFAHSMNYLQRLAASSGLIISESHEAVIRQEKGTDVRGYLVLTEKIP